jgi:hypothetical protein
MLARDRLCAALASDPGAAAGERARQRRRFADRTAALPQLDAAIEAVDAMRANVGFQRTRIGVIDFDRQTVVRANAVDQSVRLPRQASGIEGEDRDRQRILRDHVDQHHVLSAEAARERREGMARGDPLQKGDSVDEMTVVTHATALNRPKRRVRCDAETAVPAAPPSPGSCR